MAINTSRLSYQDCYDLMEKAISDEYPIGLRIKFATFNEANHFRQRIHNARYIERAENLETYPAGHTMHGRSVYDILSCRIKKLPDGWWLRLERVDAREFEIEPLTLEAVAEASVDTVNHHEALPEPEPDPPAPSLFKRRF